LRAEGQNGIVESTDVMGVLVPKMFNKSNIVIVPEIEVSGYHAVEMLKREESFKLEQRLSESQRLSHGSLCLDDNEDNNSHHSL
jgi:hypothetical protein